MSEEARKHKRFKVSWPCRLLLPSKAMLSAKVKDVSMGGVGFEVAEMIPVGESLNIEIKPMVDGKSYLIRARGSVTFSMIKGGGSGYSKGLKFEVVPEEYKSSLTEIIKNLSR